MAKDKIANTTSQYVYPYLGCRCIFIDPTILSHHGSKDLTFVRRLVSWLHLTLFRPCGHTQVQFDTSHFSLDPSQNATFQPQSFDHQWRICTQMNSAGLATFCGQVMEVIRWTADIKTASRADSDDCVYAMNRILDNCHGDHQDTRGGWFQFDSDGTTFGVDPQQWDGKHFRTGNQ